LLAIKSVTTTHLKGKLKTNLLSEIEILKSIQHPHIVALLDCMESDNHVHLVMEFCQLGDLATFIRKRDKLGAHPITGEMIRKYPTQPGAGFHEVVVRHFAKQLGAACEFLQSKDFVHRDLKPQNILLNPPPSWIANEPIENRPFEIYPDCVIPLAGLASLPTIKIADFGFARRLPKSTLAETLCGSPLYMAPEILRYERYDAKADLWSIGTVLYELIAGKPPFRAINHVELLKRIEKTNDRIPFSADCNISDDLYKVICGMLRRMPNERISWETFFKSNVIVKEIPGLHPSDRPKQVEPPRVETIQPNLPLPLRESILRPDRRESRTQENARELLVVSSPIPPQDEIVTKTPSRPVLATHITAPAAQAVREDSPRMPSNIAKRLSMATNSPVGSLPKDNRSGDRMVRRNVKDSNSSQDIAFERDYVMVEKRAVEVNAFADEMAASPHIHGARYSSTAPQPGGLIRRATTQGRPNSLTGAQVDQPLENQVAVRPEQYQHRRPSWDIPQAVKTRIPATSHLAAALQGLNQRLQGTPFYDYLGVKSPSPPLYGTFTAFPGSTGVPLSGADANKTGNLTEDQKLLVNIEECATRSDVVYGFAEVKYKQLIPINPAKDNVLGIRKTRNSPAADIDDDDLTVEAVIEIAEEALVLYVKTLAILTNTFSLASAWWNRRHRLTAQGESPAFSKSLDSDRATAPSAPIGLRVNNVVQWARTRFNECIEKSEYVTRRLSDAQNKLPRSHPGHPSNFVVDEATVAAGITSTIHLTSGITAEKLMYERAVEMSKTAAINELTKEDLPGCEVAYMTAIRLLEAVLEGESDTQAGQQSSTKKTSGPEDAQESASTEDIEEADRKDVEKGKSWIPEDMYASKIVLTQIVLVMYGVKLRLSTLRKKISVRQPMVKRHSIQATAGKTPPKSPALVSRQLA